ncbi:MAG: mitochondrial fission ELM1 family protein, partial [Candidatus Omnitrophica bacterium]|nr:mitochondrial fission ELM1 family protein [Candidatus Omnitrophota bacterium]
GMLALSEIALVTEDSISMVSEAVSAGKNVLVMQLGNGKLPKKHSQFHSVLESNALIHLANAANFSEQLKSMGGVQRKNISLRQSQLIQDALRKLL